MTPDQLVGFIDRYGLPLVILGGLLWLLLTRRLVLGSELNYVEARRLEEREGRLAAEAALRSMITEVETMGESIDKLAEMSKNAFDALMRRRQ